MKFVICAGHSNKDPGAVRNDVTESALAVELRKIVALKLRNLGHEVYTDGTDGEGNLGNLGNLPLNDAIALVKKHNCTALELHFNASASLSANGVECLGLNKDKKLCQNISNGIAGVLGSKVRGDNGFKTQEESARGKLGFVGAGGIIVETMFLSNETEYLNYTSKVWLVAQAIVDSLVRN